MKTIGRYGLMVAVALLMQAGAPSALSASCTYFISPTSRVQGYMAATGSVSVIESNGCSWQVVNPNYWITITSGSSGAGIGTVRYTIPANETLNSRTGYVQIANKVFTLVQRPPTCLYTISPTFQNYDRGPANGVVSVTTLNGCPWNVINTNRWIAITSPTNATNSGSVTYSVDANPSPMPRTGVITIAGQSFMVTVGDPGNLSLTLLGRNPLTNECHTLFTDAGATAASGPLAVAAGLTHSLALRGDGTVAGWGGNDYGQASSPGGLSNTVAIAAGGWHSLALRRDGSVAGWGDNEYGQASVPAGLTNVGGIAAGLYHSLAGQGDGSVVAWGDFSHGQMKVPFGLKNVTAVAAGNFHSLALQADGSLVAWGVYWDGSAHVPETIPEGLSGVAAIAAGDSHSLALLRNGTVISWGNNADAQTNVPVSLSNVVAIAGGTHHSLALRRDGTVAAWGGDADGQATVPWGLSNVVAIAAGGSHSLALRRDGMVFAWGDNSSGQGMVPDNLIRDLTSRVVVTGSLNTNSPGSYTLTYRATDLFGASAATNRTVVVVDTTPPVLTCPSDSVLRVEVGQQSTLAYSVLASDNCDSNARTVCSPPSGAPLQIGTTVVQCTARDASGNSNACAFSVTAILNDTVPLMAPSWGAHYVPNYGFEAVSALGVDTAGNVYVAGASYFRTNGCQYVILKYDATGRLLWEAQYGDYGHDVARALVVDGGGNVYVTGEVGGSYYDYATVKYDADGHQLWAAGYAGPAGFDDRATALAVDSAGQVYVTGRSHNSQTNYDYATIKYDANGNQLWVARYNGPFNSDDRATALGLDASGNVYVTGTSINSGTGDDYVTVKYDASGQQLWVAQYNGPGNFGDDHATALAVDRVGNVYVTGYSWGSSASSNDYATVKYNTYGNQLWVARYNGPGSSDDRPVAVVVDGAGQVYVTGSSMGSGTDMDYATIKYDADGHERWLARYNGPGNSLDQAAALAVDSSGNVYVTGGSGAAYATIKYDAGGSQSWAARYHGSGTGNDFAVALGLDRLGDVYVTGESTEQFFYYYYYSLRTIGTLKYADRFFGGAPVISVAPETQAALPGATVAFNVIASGDAPLSYQWRYNGLDLPGATNADLLLSGFQTNQAGDYSVVVTNQVGLTVSPEAHLTVGVPPASTNEAWADRYYGPGNTDDEARALVLGGAGDVFITGSSGTIKYGTNGNRFWVASTVGSALAVDSAGQVCVTGVSAEDGGYATVKYDPHGNPLWVARYQGASGEAFVANALALDAEDNVYVAGYVAGVGSDYAIIKYDSNGNHLWIARYGGPGLGDDAAKALALDRSGNVYVTGYSYGLGSGSDYLTIKYGRNGNPLWAARYNGPGNSDDFGRVLGIDSAGNVYVTGSSIGLGGDFDYATVKYDTDGNQLWVARYNGSGNAEDRARALAVDSAGNVFVTGYSVGAASGYDYATVKYDTDGNQLWVSRYNGPGNGSDQAAALALDTTGNVYVTGFSTGSGTAEDYATIKYDAQGNQLWVARCDGPDHLSDKANAIALDSSGAVYVTGRSTGHGSHADYVTIKYAQTIPSPDSPPALSMRCQANPSAVVLEWPTNVPSYHLEMADTLNTSTWTSLTNAVITNGVNRMTLNPSIGTRFFRLRKE